MKIAKIIYTISGIACLYFGWVYLKPYITKKQRKYPILIK
jgi:uncharacterized membrane protein YuzA (DUF378 family)